MFHVSKEQIGSRDLLLLSCTLCSGSGSMSVEPDQERRPREGFCGSTGAAGTSQAACSELAGCTLPNAAAGGAGSGSSRDLCEAGATALVTRSWSPNCTGEAWRGSCWLAALSSAQQLCPNGEQWQEVSLGGTASRSSHNLLHGQAAAA